MTKRVVDFDPFSGIYTTFDYDPVTDMTYIGSEQDCEPVIELCKKLQNECVDLGAKQRKNGWWHAAIYPPVIIEKWLREFGVDVFNPDHEKARLRLLNSPEYRYLKTTNLKV